MYWLTHLKQLPNTDYVLVIPNNLALMRTVYDHFQAVVAFNKRWTACWEVSFVLGAPVHILHDRELRQLVTQKCPFYPVEHIQFPADTVDPSVVTDSGQGQVMVDAELNFDCEEDIPSITIEVFWMTLYEPGTLQWMHSGSFDEQICNSLPIPLELIEKAARGII